MQEDRLGPRGRLPCPMPLPPDRLESLLNRWSETPPPSPQLAADVWRRIAHTEERQPAAIVRSEGQRPAPWFFRPAFVFTALAACLLFGWLGIEWRASRRYDAQRAELARSYLQVIDPLLSASGEPGEIDRQLAWLQRELGLTDAQFDRIRALHAASGPRLRALAHEVVRLRAELATFEDARRTTERVDFLAFARVVAARDVVDQACLDSTRQLVEATASVMTPAQRSRYLGFVNPAELN